MMPELNTNNQDQAPYQHHGEKPGEPPHRIQYDQAGHIVVVYPDQAADLGEKHLESSSHAQPDQGNVAVPGSDAPSWESPRQNQDFIDLDKAGIPVESRGWLFRGCITTLCLVTFIIAVDALIIGVSLPAIAVSLEITAIEAFWAGTSFLLTSTVFQPSFASFSHVFGRQAALLLALVFFTVGSIVAPLANSAAMLLAGRSVQGVGAGGINALSQVILTDLVSLRERGKFDSLLSIAWAVGSVTAPIIGGSLVERDWRWIFWINLPFCGVAFIAIPLTLRLAKTGATSKRIREFDWIGSFLFTASLTVFLVPLSWGGVQYPWGSYQTLVPLILGLAGLVAFGFHIVYSPGVLKCDPFLRPSLFTSLTGVTAYATSVFQWLMLFSLAYYQTLYLEVGKGYTAVMAGVFLLPYTVTIAPGAAVTGVLIAKTGKYQKAVWVGWALTTFGFGLLIIPDQNTSAVSLVFIPLAAGLGFGVLTSAQKFPSQAYASNADLPFASGLNMFFRSLGQMFGVAVGGVIFQNTLSRKISEYPHFAQYADEWSSNASALAELIRGLGPDMQEMKAVLVDSYVAAFREIWIVMTVFGGVSLLAALFGVKEKSLERSHETDQGLIAAGRKAAKTEQV